MWIALRALYSEAPDSQACVRPGSCGAGIACRGRGRRSVLFQPDITLADVGCMAPQPRRRYSSAARRVRGVSSQALPWCWNSAVSQQPIRRVPVPWPSCEGSTKAANRQALSRSTMAKPTICTPSTATQAQGAASTLSAMASGVVPCWASSAAVSAFSRTAVRTWNMPSTSAGRAGRIWTAQGRERGKVGVFLQGEERGLAVGRCQVAGEYEGAGRGCAAQLRGCTPGRCAK